MARIDTTAATIGVARVRPAGMVPPDRAATANVHAANVLSMGFCVSCHRARATDPVFPTSTDCLTCHK